MHPHGVDYTRTAPRLSWRAVPAGAVATLGERLGSRVVSASSPVGSGFGGQYAGTLGLSDGRQVFLKAAPTTLEFPAAALRREVQVLDWLPPAVPHARLLGVAEEDGWVLLAVEQLNGRLPGQPWTQADLAMAYEACVAVATTPTPVWLATSEFRDAVRRDDRVLAVEDRLSSRQFELPTTYGRDEWLGALISAHGAELAALSQSAPALLHGDALCHNDLRPDNMMMTSGGAVLIDWNFVTVAPSWLDFVGLLPMAHRQGLALRRWWSSPLLRDASPEQIAAFLAVLTVYFLSAQEHPPAPGCTDAARRHQLVYAHDFARLLAHRRGWRA